MFINILLHGITEKITLGLGIPSLILGIVGGSWIAFLTPIVLMVGGSLKYFFEIRKLRTETKKEKAELLLAELETEKLKQENDLREIEIQKSRQSE